MKRSAVIVLIILLILLLLGLGVGLYLVTQRSSFFGRAFGPTTVTDGEAKLENSYLFASPLQANADGQERIRVTVFVLDSQGRGIAGKQIVLVEDPRINTEAIQSVSDVYGRALFDVSSTTAADFSLEAKVDNQALPQKVRISFR